MIALQHAETGEIQVLESAEIAEAQGYAAPDWVEVDLPAPPIPSLMPAQLWQLLTVAEHAAARSTADETGLVAVAFDRINARRDPLPLNDGNFVALVLRLVELEVLTETRATAVLAGDMPA